MCERLRPELRPLILDPHSRDPSFADLDMKARCANACCHARVAQVLCRCLLKPKYWPDFSRSKALTPPGFPSSERSRNRYGLRRLDRVYSLPSGLRHLEPESPAEGDLLPLGGQGGVCGVSWHGERVPCLQRSNKSRSTP